MRTGLAEPGLVSVWWARHTQEQYMRHMANSTEIQCFCSIICTMLVLERLVIAQSYCVVAYDVNILYN